MTQGFKGWEYLYEELSEMILKNIDAVKWIDLWHNQVGFMVEEHPFTTPALFMAFRLVSADEMGENTQAGNIQVDLYYFYETFLDTFNDAVNKTDAMDYLKTTTELHKLFHGTTGENYSEMTRTAFAPVDTGTAGNLYRISFSAKIIDATATKGYDPITPGEINVSKGSAPEVVVEKAFDIPG